MNKRTFALDDGLLAVYRLNHYSCHSASSFLKRIGGGPKLRLHQSKHIPHLVQKLSIASTHAEPGTISQQKQSIDSNYPIKLSNNFSLQNFSVDCTAECNRFPNMQFSGCLALMCQNTRHVLNVNPQSLCISKLPQSYMC